MILLRILHNYYRLTPLIILLFLQAPRMFASDSVQLDPSIRYGKLDNGFTYYLKPLEDQEKVKMYLVLKGALRQQQKGEYEFAHFLEHLAFVAGKNVSRSDNRMFEEAGIDITAINAHPYADHMTYLGSIPSTEKAINLTLQFYKDILWDLELSDEKINKERLSIINEAIVNPASVSKMAHSLEMQLFGEGLKRPVNFKQYVRNIEADKIRKYYLKWYRPELASLVVVGDLKNLDDLELNVIKQFSSKTKEKSVDPELTGFEGAEYFMRKPQFLRAAVAQPTDNVILEKAVVGLFYRQDNSNYKKGLKDKVFRELFIGMLKKRFNNQAEAYNTFYSVLPEFITSAYALKIEIVANTGLSRELLIKTQGLLNEVEKTGFSNEEFEDGKVKLLQSQPYRDTLQSNYWKEEIIKNFLYDEALPASKPDVLKNIIQQIELTDFNREIATYLKAYPDDITFTSYQKSNNVKIENNEIRQWLKAAKSFKFSEPDISKAPKSLMSSNDINSLTNKKIIEASSEIPGTKKFLLANGVTLYLKSQGNNKTTNGTIKLRAFSPFGANCLEKEKFYSAINASQVTINSGINDMNKFELENYLDSHDFKGFISPYIENNETGFRGSFSKSNVEIALQLINQYFTNPQFSKAAFKDWKTRSELHGQNIELSDEFHDRVAETLPNHNMSPLAGSLLRGLEKTEYKDVFTSYKKMFGRPGNFTFIFSGDFEQNNFLTVCNKYLGSIPSISVKPLICNSSDSKRIPSKAGKRVFKANQSSKVTFVQLNYLTKFTNSELGWKEWAKLDLIRKILLELFYKKLRFESEKGGIYDAYSGLEFVESNNYLRYSAEISCLPEDADRLTKEAKKIIDSLSNEIISDSLFKNLKNNHLKYYQWEGLQFNKLYKTIRDDKEWISIDQEQEYIKSLTKQDLLNTAKQYLSGEPYEFRMIPN